MYKVNLKRMFNLPSGKGAYKLEDGSFCAIGKLMTETIGEDNIAQLIEFKDKFIGCILTYSRSTPEAESFIAHCHSKGVKISEVIEKNDCNGDYDGALKQLIQECLEKGVIELDEESLELSKEFLTISNKEKQTV